MHIDYLELRGFRNLECQAIHFPKQLTVVVGKNGEGKTNLIEALYLLAHGKSFRGARPGELVRWSTEGVTGTKGDADCVVSAGVRTAGGKSVISCQVRDGKRKILINDKQVLKTSLFYGQVTAVEFTPDQLLLIKGPPTNRRQFIDRLLSMGERTYVEHLVHYHRALRQRNALLAAGTACGADALKGLQGKLAPWDAALVSHGFRVARKRRELVSIMEEPFERCYRYLVRAPCALTEERSEKVSLQYKSAFLRDGMFLEQEQAHALLASTVSEDARYKNTQFGPHRDDLEFFLDTGSGAHPARKSASQGQARCMVLALKLAGVEYLHNATGETPVLLLDDIESELDIERKEALFTLIRELKAQVIVTATEVSPYLRKHLDAAQVLAISSGRVEVSGNAKAA